MYDLLAHYEAGDWNVEIPLIISNHPDMKVVAEQFNIPYEIIPVTKDNKEEMEEDFNAHKVENYFDLFTGMFAQPDKPSFSIFTVKGTTITVDSYTANPDGSADKFNSFVVKRVKEHTPFTGLENVVVDQIPQTNGVAKILYNGQILLVKDGVAYDVLGQVIVNK